MNNWEIASSTVKTIYKTMHFSLKLKHNSWHMVSKYVSFRSFSHSLPPYWEKGRGAFKTEKKKDVTFKGYIQQADHFSASVDVESIKFHVCS